jgi:D-sedoheptulose 7-phosphate isomerase
MMNYTDSAQTYFKKLAVTLSHLDDAAFDRGIELIVNAWQNKRQIITLGNGGSALTALHFINDWNKSIFLETGVAFSGRSLCDNLGLLTSYANDISYQDIFVAQLKNCMQKNDLVIAISGSGNSENVIRAVEYANDHGGVTLGLCGFRGGRLKEKAQHHIWVDRDDMQIVEDIHSMFGHIVMQTLCGYMKKAAVRDNKETIT